MRFHCIAECNNNNNTNNDELCSPAYYFEYGLIFEWRIRRNIHSISLLLSILKSAYDFKEEIWVWNKNNRTKSINKKGENVRNWDGNMQDSQDDKEKVGGVGEGEDRPELHSNSMGRIKRICCICYKCTIGNKNEGKFFFFAIWMQFAGQKSLKWSENTENTRPMGEYNAYNFLASEHKSTKMQIYINSDRETREKTCSRARQEEPGKQRADQRERDRESR